MVDWFVILTPLLVLAMILLLGFTGCDFKLPEAEPSRLTLEVRLPSQLTFLRSLFQLIEPGSAFLRTVTDLVRTDDGFGTIVLSHVIDEPVQGSWSVVCALQVSDRTRQAFSQGAGLFTLDPGARCVAEFETSGAPATNDFKVSFIGLVCEQ